jgi:hypothetical protein
MALAGAAGAALALLAHGAFVKDVALRSIEANPTTTADH